MKKFALVIAVMALVLLVGQTAFAAGSNAGLKLGYAKASGDAIVGNQGTIFSDSYSAFQLGISASYYTQINVSASLKLNLGFGKTFRSSAHPDFIDNTLKTFMLNLHAFIKYDIYNGYGISVAPQIGMILDSDRSNVIETVTLQPGQSTPADYTRSAIFLAAGLFVRVDVTPKVEVYLDAKFPILYSFAYTNTPDLSGSFDSFYYDVTLGVLYEILPNLFVGVEANASNSTGRQVYDVNHGKDSFGFDVGAKIEFKF